MMLTRYAIGRFEHVKKLSCRPGFSFFRVFKALTDSFLCIGPGGYVGQTLTGLSVLNDGRGLPIHRKHHGALTFFQLFHKVTDQETECRQLLGCGPAARCTKNSPYKEKRPHLRGRMLLSSNLDRRSVFPQNANHTPLQRH